jgi:FdhD protein
MQKSTVSKVEVVKISNQQKTVEEDFLAVEEPLEIRIQYGEEGSRKVKNASITMRTPGNDNELATGFLFTEGIIKSIDEVVKIENDVEVCMEGRQNTITVGLKENIMPKLDSLERNFYTTSSCGVCGKASLESIRTLKPNEKLEPIKIEVDFQILKQLPGFLRKSQNDFEATGGLHASALFDINGDLLLIKEDVGRHNALDKLIGSALLNNIPIHNCIVLLSGRVSFELVQKAAMAGIRIIAAIGAPSSLALDLAREFDITLIGFLSNSRFNIYHGENRVIL